MSCGARPLGSGTAWVGTRTWLDSDPNFRLTGGEVALAWTIEAGTVHQQRRQTLIRCCPETRSASEHLCQPLETVPARRSEAYHLAVAASRAGLRPMHNAFGWTSSSYSPYPDYRPAPGPPGQCNGNFMVDHLVLRGGSCATPVNHMRTSHRNFFHPDARRWFIGVGLARDV